jgi:nucleoside-diphosphate-sugar epimerase
MKAEKAIFVTGATGLVGGFWTLTALRAGHSVRLLVRGKRINPPRSASNSPRLFGFSARSGAVQFLYRNLRRRYRLPQFGLPTGTGNIWLMNCPASITRLH